MPPRKLATVEAEANPSAMSARLASSSGSSSGGDYEFSWPPGLSCGRFAELLDCVSDANEAGTMVDGGPTTMRAVSFSGALARRSMIWARYTLEQLPIRLTLENVGIFAVLLALIMPRAFTYCLVYPIFRLVFGTLYPAYASYKAVRTKDVKEYVKWMMYWIVFAFFTCAETFTDVFFSFWFPFYYEIKIILVLWLLSPATKGSSILYRRFVHPALCRREDEIDEALARATEQGYTAVLQLGTKGVNYATTFLMQTAIKNFPNVVPSGSLAASQSDPAISSLANRRASPSRSETDGRSARTEQQEQLRRRARRRTKSEDDVLETRGWQPASDSEDNFYEDLEMDMIQSAMETTSESVEVVDFKKPEQMAKRERKRREDSVTRRKPRTRGQTARNLDSDLSDYD